MQNFSLAKIIASVAALSGVEKRPRVAMGVIAAATAATAWAFPATIDAVIGLFRFVADLFAMPPRTVWGIAVISGVATLAAAWLATSSISVGRKTAIIALTAVFGFVLVSSTLALLLPKAETDNPPVVKLPPEAIPRPKPPLVDGAPRRRPVVRRKQRDPLDEAFVGQTPLTAACRLLIGEDISAVSGVRLCRHERCSDGTIIVTAVSKDRPCLPGDG